MNDGCPEIHPKAIEDHFDSISNFLSVGSQEIITTSDYNFFEQYIYQFSPYF